MAQQDDDLESFSFIYFALTILTLIVLPLTYSIFKTPISILVFASHTRNAKYAKVHKMDSRKIVLDQQIAKYKWLNKYYALKFVVWLVLFLVLVNAYQQLPDPSKYKGFDPYEILGVGQFASVQEIKRAYRKLVVVHHPDKNEGQDSEQFILIMKAYECLTDPKKIQNCRKYGNPDGYHAYKVGIALPQFLLQSHNKALYLGVIFFGFIAFVIFVLASIFSNIGKYDANGILTSNAQVFQQTIKNKKLKNQTDCLVMLSKLREFQSLKYPQIKCLRDKLGITQENDAYVILQAYMNRLDELELTPQVAQILQLCPNAIQSCLNMCLVGMQQERLLQLRGRQNKSGLKLADFQNNVQLLLDFMPRFIQCLKEHDLDIDQIQELRDRTDKSTLPSLSGLIEQGQFKNPELDTFPQVSMETQVKPFDDSIPEDELTSSDKYVITVKIIGKDDMYVHSNRYPLLKEHKWSVTLLMNKEIYQFRKMEGDVRSVEFSLVPILLTGEKNQVSFKFGVVCQSDSYVHLRFEKEIRIETKIASKETQELLEEMEEEEEEEEEETREGKEKRD